MSLCGWVGVPVLFGVVHWEVFGAPEEEHECLSDAVRGSEENFQVTVTFYGCSIRV